MTSKLAVIAIGGNSLIKDDKHVTVESQYEAAKETAIHIADMIEQGCNDFEIEPGPQPAVEIIIFRSPCFALSCVSKSLLSRFRVHNSLADEWLMGEAK